MTMRLRSPKDRLPERYKADIQMAEHEISTAVKRSRRRTSEESVKPSSARSSTQSSGEHSNFDKSMAGTRRKKKAETGNSLPKPGRLSTNKEGTARKTISQQPRQPKKARFDSVAQPRRSKGQEEEEEITSTITLKSRFKRRKNYRFGESAIDGQFFDRRGNPQHGIGERLEQLEGGKYGEQPFLSEKDALVCGGSAFLEKHQRYYEKRCYEPILRNNHRNGKSIMPSDIPTDMAACPQDFLAFQGEMATSDEEDETVDRTETKQGTEEFLALHPGLQWLILEEIEDDFERSHVTDNLPLYYASMALLGIEHVRTCIEIKEKGRALKNTPTALPSKEQWDEAAKWLDRAKLPRSLISLYES